MCYRSLVFRPYSDSTLTGNNMWIRAWGGERSPEFHELPDGPPALPHGHLCPSATTLRHSCHRLRSVHFHGTHHVLPVCQESQAETTHRYINNTDVCCFLCSVSLPARATCVSWADSWIISAMQWKASAAVQYSGE